MAGNAVQIIIQAVDKASKEINTIKKSMGDLDQTAGDSDKSIGGMGKSLGGLVGKLSLVAGAAASFGMVAKQAFELGKEGASLLRLEEASGKLASSLGSNMDEVVQAVSRASLGMVSDMDIMAASSRAMMLGVSSDSKELADLMEIAASKARAMGISTTQAFNDIITGIGRGSPLILDNLGIIVNATETNKKYAESIGKTALQLTEAEKTQALLNRVLEEGSDQLLAVGGLTEDAAASFEKLAANSKNAADNMKKNFAPAVAEIANLINQVAFGTNTLIGQIQAEADAIKASGASRQEQIAGLRELIDGTNTYIDANGNLVQSFATQEGQMTRVIMANYLLLDSTEPLPGMVDTLTSAQSSANDVMAANYDHIAELVTGHKNLADAQREAAESAGNQQIATNNLAESLKNATKVQFAKAFINELSEAKGVSAETLGAMSTEIMLHFGIIDEKGLAAAEGIGLMADEIGRSRDLAVPAGEAIEILMQGVADGVLDWPKLSEAIFKTHEPTEGMTDRTEDLAEGFLDLNSQMEPAAAWAETMRQRWQALLNMERKISFKVDYENGGGGGGAKFNTTVAQDFGIGFATGGEGTVPSGYPGDSFPIFTTSGETATVQTPVQKFETDRRYEAIMSALAGQRPATAQEIATAVRDAILMIPG